MPEQLIKIDLQRIKATVIAAMPHGADRSRIVRGIGAAAMHYWKTLASQQLRSSKQDYIDGLELKEGRDGHGTEVSLNGALPNMIEQGWSGGDMRAWLLSSPKAKQGKRGPYLVVPFRHGTPGTVNAGAAMPGSIHTVVQKLMPTLSRPGKPVSTAGGQTTVYGKRLHPGLPMRQAARQILNRVEKPWHATSVYMGMIRKAQMTKKGLQTSGYQTFRTISANTRQPEFTDTKGEHGPAGDKRGHWVHPGIKARNIARQVERHLEKIATHVVRQAGK